MAQMKEQIKTPEKEVNKMEISNLSEAEFKILVIRILKELGGYFNSIKKTQAEMEVTLIEIKNNLQGNNRSMDEAKNQNNIEQKKQKNTNHNNKEKRTQKYEDTVSSLWDYFKHSNVCIIGVPEEKRKSKKLEIYLKK